MDLPEPFLPETSPAEEANEPHQLNDLTSQSWNLEMLISGAALFATLSLPDILDSLLAYYRYDLMTDTDFIHEIIPAQVIGLIKGVSYFLFGAFLTHFVMRAFWVGLVGLLAVYPSGIRYDQVYNLSQYARKRFAQEMGSLPDYIVRLDRRCNIIFALAFSLVLLLLGVAAAYGLLILTETILQLLLPNTLYNTVRELVGWVFGIGFSAITLTILILNLPKFRENPRLAPLSFQLSQSFSVVFLGLYRPLLYIMYTFYSQIPKQVLKQRLVWFFVIFLLTEMIFIYMQLLTTLGASDVLDSRSFITLRVPDKIADPNSFDNLRNPNEQIANASIQADVIREPYVRLFVSYPKSLDAELSKRFREPNWPVGLSRKERRERRANWYLSVFETYFGVYLNDSLYKSPGFLFTQHVDTGQRGLTTVLVTANLKTGRNLLKLTVPDSTNKPIPYYQIPFWYVPEN
ncbi:hypothetical protein GO730_06925 [Spirosoma sp. HMF3257]|uniref:Uncharacterized protein n=1 Tax=Spirosoma telluris TaxID=2183553 RepID=A0A327NFV0_9BACT|nr:hypothetical protein [Spirosoma telluris]RAI74132.1 hypothetical protein HMF3257_06860 [Spirosoma telluris]